MSLNSMKNREPINKELSEAWKQLASYLTGGYLMVGWSQIHKMFRDRNGKPVISQSTLQQRYGPQMLRLGVCMKLHLGKGKRPVVCAWPRKVMEYFRVLFQKEG